MTTLSATMMVPAVPGAAYPPSEAQPFISVSRIISVPENTTAFVIRGANEAESDLGVDDWLKVKVSTLDGAQTANTTLDFSNDGSGNIATIGPLVLNTLVQGSGIYGANGHECAVPVVAGDFSVFRGQDVVVEVQCLNVHPPSGGSSEVWLELRAQ